VVCVIVFVLAYYLPIGNVWQYNGQYCMEVVMIGKGVLNWPKGERVSDRYGLVGLFDVEGRNGSILPIDVSEYVGKKGKLIARVLEARDSWHIGDFARGLYPNQPKTGEIFTLGEGTFFIGEEHRELNEYFGLRPDEDRSSDWLDPHVLYKLHNQTVELVFEETG
jgi:hypothetical protein